MNPAEIMAHQPAQRLPTIPKRVGPGRKVGDRGEALVKAYARRNGLSLEEIKSRSAAFRIAHPRQGAMFELYVTGDYSFPTIAVYFGVDQSTVRHGVHAYAKWLEAHEARGGGA